MTCLPDTEYSQKLVILTMFCTKELKFALINAPALIAVLIERLSSSGSGGSPGSNPGSDRTVFVYTESVIVHAWK